jgi:hypothetical protein
MEALIPSCLIMNPNGHCGEGMRPTIHMHGPRSSQLSCRCIIAAFRCKFHSKLPHPHRTLTDKVNFSIASSCPATNSPEHNLTAARIKPVQHDNSYLTCDSKFDNILATSFTPQRIRSYTQPYALPQLFHSERHSGSCGTMFSPLTLI